MKTPLKIGEKVVIYTSYGVFTGEVERFSDDLVVVVFSDRSVGAYHPKQLRRLVKKKREEYVVRRCEDDAGHDRVWNFNFLDTKRECPYCQVFKVRRLPDGT